MAGADEDDPVVLEIEDSIDLHGFEPRDIPSVVVSYLEAAREKGLHEVRLIHGKGKGVQRARVRQVLDGLSWVIEYRNAPETRGGFGATLVWLEP
ncbi:MAG: Smr/MutS family protein [Polyangiaceae bacterium]